MTYSEMRKYPGHGKSCWLTTGWEMIDVCGGSIFKWDKAKDISGYLFLTNEKPLNILA